MFYRLQMCNMIAHHCLIIRQSYPQNAVLAVEILWNAVELVIAHILYLEDNEVQSCCIRVCRGFFGIIAPFCTILPYLGFFEEQMHNDYHKLSLVFRFCDKSES